MDRGNRILASTVLLSIVPPWLRGPVGTKFIGGLGDVIDDLIDRTADGAALRFPFDNPDPDALALIGRERRIRRGPGESAKTYANRIRGWWDAHKTRGGPYALLGQLYAFFKDTYDVRIDVVAQSGNRHYITAGGGGVVTHDSITWTGDGSGGWAHIWVFYYLTEVDDELVLDDGTIIIDDAGDEISVSTLFSGTISADDAEQFLAVPREWSAAHIPYVTVVLLYGLARLWNYPQPITDTWGAPPARTWAEPVPIILTTGN